MTPPVLIRLVWHIKKTLLQAKPVHISAKQTLLAVFRFNFNMLRLNRLVRSENYLPTDIIIL